MDLVTLVNMYRFPSSSYESLDLCLKNFAAICNALTLRTKS